MHFSESFSPHVFTYHQGTTSLSSVTEKTRPRLPKISQWSSRLTTFRFTQFTEHSPPVVRDPCETHSSVLTGLKARTAPSTSGTRMRALG